MARKAKTLKMKAAPKTTVKPGRRALITQSIGKKRGGYKKK